MRHSKFLVAITALSAFPLAACGDGSAFDESFKTQYREKLVSTCAATAGSYVPTGANLELDKICGCAADKVMAGKSATDLATTVPGSAEDLAKIRQCATELYPDGVNIKLGS